MPHPKSRIRVICLCCYYFSFVLVSKFQLSQAKWASFREGVVLTVVYQRYKTSSMNRLKGDP